ncbi:MAG: flavin-dependent dehydrogenase [Gammaproteobacteria bacterium]|jgi:flavin-dependent dehydrogenase
MSTLQPDYDVLVIGAGPSGALVSSLLNAKGHRVLVLEKQYFPRFSIGESLLPQSMEFLEQAGMLPAVHNANFQMKNGAAFAYREQYASFDFRKKLSSGWGTTYQVQRDQFDKILADEASSQGVEIRYGQTVTAFEYESSIATLSVDSDCGKQYQVSGALVLDASGFGRVLPRLLNLEKASDFAPKTSIFTHLKDNNSDPQFDRDKILISVHPQLRDVWYWLIPFSNGRSSAGVVFSSELYGDQIIEHETLLKELISKSGLMASILKNAEYDTRIASVEGYACDVEQLYGDGYALLGNAGEFLDPVFSSGVTIALKSASLAADVVDRQLTGTPHNWLEDYANPLKQGVDTFRTFVEGWYDGSLQTVIFAKEKSPTVKRLICSILAGYAWDLNNPYVKDSARLKILAAVCRSQ